MREERVVLEDQADIALVDRHIVDAPSGDEDLARGRLNQAGNGAQDRGLAAAGRPKQSDEAALVERKVDMVNGDERAIGEGDASAIDGGSVIDRKQLIVIAFRACGSRCANLERGCWASSQRFPWSAQTIPLRASSDL